MTLEESKPLELQELQIQFINVRAIIFINDNVYYVDCIDQHKLIRYVEKDIKTFSIIKSSYQGKITAILIDRANSTYTDLGEIKSDKTFTINN